jgi:hypothetical protein
MNDRLIETSALIAAGEPPDRVDFLHSVLCQVGMPRRRLAERTFERSSGTASLAIEAGRLWDGRRWVEQPLPYGAPPRLVLVHVSSEAVRTRSPVVEVGHSIRSFMRELGMDPGGRELTRFKRQMSALAACRMVLGTVSRAGRPITIAAQPIESFEAWLHPTGEQRTLWPGTLELSSRFYETVVAHAVPLDPRALAALRGSALALDTYAWLAHRLCRIKRQEGVKVTWQNLRDQFGQEYRDPRDFRREIIRAIRATMAAYPHAKIEQVDGGLVLRPSPPPIRKTISATYRRVDS